MKKQYRVMMDYCAEPLWEYPYGCNLDMYNLPFYLEPHIKEKLKLFKDSWYEAMDGKVDLKIVDDYAMECAQLLKNSLPDYEFLFFKECDGRGTYDLKFVNVDKIHNEESRQTIQNFLNCCIMETQGKPVTHEELASLLDFYFSEDDYWKGVDS